MKCFVTGATGFIGSHLAEMLLNKKHEVIALVRNPLKAVRLKEMGAKIVKGDVTNKDSMHEAMTGCDWVFHVAGWYKVGAKNKAPGWDINVQGTRNVLELIKELGIKKGVYTSTVAINSDTHGKMVDESYRFEGTHLSEYDRTKAEAHKLAQQFITEGLPLVILMPGAVYGPKGTSLTDESLRLFLKNKLPLIPKDMELCWSHVDDVAQAHILAMEKAEPGSTYIIAGPRHSAKEVFELAHKITGIKKPIAVPTIILKILGVLASMVSNFVDLPEMYSPEAFRVQAGRTYLGDSSKAKNDLGYNPRTLEDGLKETLRYEQEKLK